jgi:hypothetical protein
LVAQLEIGTHSQNEHPLRALSAAEKPIGQEVRQGVVVTDVEPAGDEVERALSAADAARRSGDRAAAVRHFEAAIAATAPSDPRRGMAALSLARLLLATDPGKAAAVLNGSFAAVPRALQEDAWARRVEAEGRAGHLVEAACGARVRA